MAICKACGAELIFIKLPGGKAMPCNAQPIPFRNNLQRGALKLILPDGRIARGDFDPSSDVFGYESHFATCPAAARFRKEGRATNGGNRLR